jgi:hypothetical protein
MTSGPVTWSGHRFLADIISHAWLYHLSPFSGYYEETGSWCDPPFSMPDRLFRFQRAFAKFFQAVSKQFGDALQEAAGAGGAFAVHEEFDNPAVLRIDADRLGVLAADVDDGPGLAVERVLPNRMARYSVTIRVTRSS